MIDSRLPLAGMTAVITAGSCAIGSATATVLVRDGAHVLISGRTGEKLERVAEALKPDADAAGGSIRWAVADALEEAQIRNLVQLAREPTGRIDMAVAVVGGGAATPVLRYTIDSLEGTLRRNIVSTFLLLKHAGGAMVSQGGGSFVAISAMQAVEEAPLHGAYCAAKAGLEMFCRVAADELGEHRVRVNMVRPGLIRNGRATHPTSNEQAVEAFMEQQLLKQQGEPENVAHAIRYFLGPESEWTTGTSLTVDGGTSLRRFPDLGFYWSPDVVREIGKAARGEVD